MRGYLYVLLLLLLASNPVDANFAIFQVSNTNVIAFTGDPNTAATANTIAGSITCSRTSGTTPMFLQCSANAITATGASAPYEQGEFSWNFGDASGTETLTDPFSGQTVNLNSTQVKPEASYVYRNAGTGTYTITLSVRFCTSGNCTTTPTYTTAQITQNISVTAFNPSGGTFYYSAAGSGTTCSSGSPCPISQFASKLASNTQHNFNLGDSFAGTTNLNVHNVSAVRIGTFGSGAAPKINITSGANSPLSFATTNGQTTSDIVISGIELDVSSSATSGNNVTLSTTTTGVLQNIYLDNATLSNSLDIAGFINLENQPFGVGGSDTNQFTGCWMCALSSPLSATTTLDGFLGGPYNWNFFVGGSIVGSGTNHTLDHHFYGHAQTHTEVSYVSFGNSDPTGLSPTRNYNVKLSWTPGTDGPSGFSYGQYVSVTHNSMGGTQRSINLANATNDPTASRFKNVVYSKNVKQGFTGEDDLGVGETATMRDEVYCNNGTNTLNGMTLLVPLTGTTSFLTPRIYRQRIYTTSAQPVFDFQPAGFTWSTGGEFTDNQVQGTSSSAEMMNTVFSQQTGSSALWDRSSYYCPNEASSACFFNNGVAKTLAQWQAAGLGPNDNQTNPNFPAPASCNLGTRLP